MTKKVFVVDVSIEVKEHNYIQADSEEEAKAKVQGYHEYLGNDEAKAPDDRDCAIGSCHYDRKFKVLKVKEANYDDLVNQLFLDDC